MKSKQQETIVTIQALLDGVDEMIRPKKRTPIPKKVGKLVERVLKSNNIIIDKKVLEEIESAFEDEFLNM